MRKFYLSVCILVILVSLLLSGCNPAQPVIEAPTPDNQAMAATADALRTQVAATVVGGMTATAQANPPTASPLPTETTAPTSTEAPSATPLASITPPPTVIFLPTSTPTRRVILPTATATQGAYQCAVVKQSITYGMKVSAGVDFDARWTVKNIGTQNWASGAADYAYVEGARLHAGDDAYDLNTEVKTGKTVDIIVDMLAPKETGYYQAIWAMKQDGDVMCYMQIDINVE